MLWWSIIIIILKYNVYDSKIDGTSSCKYIKQLYVQMSDTRFGQTRGHHQGNQIQSIDTWKLNWLIVSNYTHLEIFWHFSNLTFIYSSFIITSLKNDTCLVEICRISLYITNLNYLCVLCFYRNRILGPPPLTVITTLCELLLYDSFDIRD